MAKVNTYERKGAISSDDVEIVNPEKKFSIDDTAKGNNPLMGALDISTDKMYSPADISKEAFMAQEVEVHLAEPANEDENQFAEITVNGDYRLVRRGDTCILKRYHVAVLAQAKEMRMKQTRVVNLDGSMGYQEKMVTRQTYPFSVIHDPSGRKGSDWLRQQLQNNA